MLLSTTSLALRQNEIDPSILSVIRKDVERTFCGRVDASSLERVLMRTARVCGYVQGMNFVCGLTLIAVEDEDLALSCMLTLVQKLEGLYDPSHVKLAKVCRVLDVFVEAYLPRTFALLSQYGILSEHYAIGLFLSMFTTRFDVESSLFVLEKFAIDGYKWLFRVALLLLSESEDAISEAQSEPESLLLLLSRMNISSGLHLLDEADERFKITNSMVKRIESRLSDSSHLSLLLMKDLSNNALKYQLVDGPPVVPKHAVVPPVFSCVKGEGLDIHAFLLRDLDSGHTRLFQDALDSHASFS